MSASSSITLLEKWRLLGRMMADRALAPTAKEVGFVLLDHHNAETGRCDPSQRRIAKRLGVSDRSVGAAIAALKERGYFAHQRRGFRTNRYQPILSAAPSGGTHDRQKSADQTAGANRQSAADQQRRNRQVSADLIGSPLPMNTPRNSPKEDQHANKDIHTQGALLLPIDGKRGQATAEPQPRPMDSLHPDRALEVYTPGPEIAGWAEQHAAGIELGGETLAHFKDHYRAKGWTPADLDAAFRKWLRGAAERRGRSRAALERRSNGGPNGHAAAPAYGELKGGILEPRRPTTPPPIGPWSSAAPQQPLFPPPVPGQDRTFEAEVRWMIAHGFGPGMPNWSTWVRCWGGERSVRRQLARLRESDDGFRHELVQRWGGEEAVSRELAA